MSVRNDVIPAVTVDSAASQLLELAPCEYTGVAIFERHSSSYAETAAARSRDGVMGISRTILQIGIMLNVMPLAA